MLGLINELCFQGFDVKVGTFMVETRRYGPLVISYAAGCYRVEGRTCCVASFDNLEKLRDFFTRVDVTDDTDIIASAPVYNMGEALTCRLVLRKCRDQYIVHMQINNNGYISYTDGDYFDKFNYRRAVEKFAQRMLDKFKE
jgi:hypothetical protein